MRGNAMYTCLKNVQILISLLKQYGIRHIVISAGTRHTPLVHSVEQDPFFQTYSVVDERSASFFAIGMIEQLREPVAVCCTSGSAAANYVSAANEAFYQELPLLLLTADRNHYYQFQQEEQMIPQEGLYAAVCKKVVTLNHVRDEKDAWYCARLCNEALMELFDGKRGPVHINFVVENDYPVHQGIVRFDTETLPAVRKTERLTLEASPEEWQRWAERLKQSKVLIIFGQRGPVSARETALIEAFCERYSCVVMTDLLSNLHCSCSLHSFPMARMMNAEELKALAPDILITMNAFSISELKYKLGNPHFFREHWHVSPDGQISDPFKCLPDTVACSPMTFFEKFTALAEPKPQNAYLAAWRAQYERIGNQGSLNDEPVAYSSMYGIQQLIRRIPDGALLHIGNSNSIRLANYFQPSEKVTVCGNRGTHGIDGSMSAFVGQAHISGRLSFLILGDLSFFYDMNALWNQYVGKNLRILLCNNSGGGIFHSYPNQTNVPTLDEHIAAEHHTSAEAWVRSRGFTYLSCRNKEEFDRALPQLLAEETDAPVILEMFTDKETDAECIRTINSTYLRLPPPTLKQRVGSMLSEDMKDTIKKFLH